MSPYAGSTPYLSLKDVREEHLNEEQKALLGDLRMLSSRTQRSYASAFKGYLARRPYVPANIHAARAWVAGVRWGCRLNTLHPDPDISDGWKSLLPNIWVPEVEFHDEVGARYIHCVDRNARQGRRRHRLAHIPENFVELMLAESSLNSRSDLHFALLLLFLTGCRPSEIASASFEFSNEDVRVTIACAKEKFNENNSRSRMLTLERQYGVFARYLNNLKDWVGLVDRSLPFSHLNAAAMNNLCARLSKKLWPKKKIANPSCFRCLFIADLKKEGVPREQIAAQVGHLAEKSASRYGTARQGRDGRRAYLCIEQSEATDDNSMRPRG
ncbi:hypothetical protein [Variovorax saccharolyticus]|uniref:hypothetical protein n=1 Tax=Variovorax saccharolyticus TaxID=3053516 RepID=UPI002578EB28|nr:hypothetical protein [Variovorax sp. J22R187]MDM0017547.1 hypothetical protein [Variovorax sp. J22R187]